MARQKPHPIVQVFFRGLALILPLALTTFVLAWLWNLVDSQVVGRVDNGVRWLVEKLVGVERATEVLPPGLRLGVSIVATVAFILLLGWWLSGFIGRRVYQAFERLLGRTPVIGAIYPHVKQITEFFFADDKDKKIEFERVVAIPYPRQGLYSLALLTGSSLRSLNKAAGEQLISVFIPSSPMPATGYTIFVPARDIIPMNMTVDDAVRTIISAGVLVPPSEREEVVLTATPSRPLPQGGGAPAADPGSGPAGDP